MEEEHDKYEPITITLNRELFFNVKEGAIATNRLKV